MSAYQDVLDANFDGDPVAPSSLLGRKTGGTKGPVPIDYIKYLIMRETPSIEPVAVEFSAVEGTPVGRLAAPGWGSMTSPVDQIVVNGAELHLGTGVGTERYPEPGQFIVEIEVTE